MTKSPISALHPAQAGSHVWGLLVLRLGLVLLSSVLAWIIIRAATGVAGYPPETVWATLGLFPINVLCLVVVIRLYRRQGVRLRDALGVRRGRVGRDMLWGLLWLMVMNIPFMMAVAGMVFLLYGRDAPAAFETIFVNVDASVALDPVVLLSIAILAVVPFMVLNGPTEELIFRGYALSGLVAHRSRSVAIVVTSVFFGLQHVFFAATLPGMLVFFVAFTVWGLTAAIIVMRQGRLLPVVIAHMIVNIGLSSPAIVFPILQLTGVIPTGGS